MDDQIILEEKDFQKLKDFLEAVGKSLIKTDTVKIDLQTIAHQIGFEHFYFDSFFFGEGLVLKNSQLNERLDELPPKLANWLRTRRRKDMDVQLGPEDFVLPVVTASASGTTDTADNPEDAGTTDTAGSVVNTGSPSSTTNTSTA
jgi:hypothetical protein